QDTLIALFGGVFAVLALASSVGGLLRWRLAGRSSSVIDNLNARIKAWWWMIGALAIAFWIGKTGVVVLFAFISLQALREFISVT
ncbi:phosphatidate cytidylyltransferase, partial [Acinetobacter baumannii]